MPSNRNRDRVGVSVSLTPEDAAALRVEAFRSVEGSVGGLVDRILMTSQYVTEALRHPHPRALVFHNTARTATRHIELSRRVYEVTLLPLPKGTRGIVLREAIELWLADRRDNGTPPCIP